MTDQDEFYVDSPDTFPSKEDFEGRLVAIWPTGKVGTREGQQGAYGWVETVTMALDDGPDGTAGTGTRSDGEEYLVGPAPEVVEDFQWSATGIYSRVKSRIGKKLDDGSGDFRPVIGRIHKRKSTQKGKADPWGLAKPTDADREIINRRADDIKAQMAKMRAKAEEAVNADAFA